MPLTPLRGMDHRACGCVGDGEDPRGGVRGVIPDKQNYLEGRGEG